MFTFAAMKIIPLSEGAFSVDKTKAFVPFDKTKDEIDDRPQGSLLVEVQPFAVITSHDVLLLDAGLGFEDGDGILQIHKNLIEQDINPLEVTKVLLSHLHKDHSGGLFTFDSIQQQYFPAFPNATYYVNRKEFEDAIAKGRPSYEPDDFSELAKIGNVEFIGENGTIDGYIHYEQNGGHSPFHQSFLIEENGEKIFFGADVAPQLKQMKTKFIAKYDHDGKRSMELRQQWWEQGNKEGWKFLFYHDIKTPVFPH